MFAKGEHLKKRIVSTCSNKDFGPMRNSLIVAAFYGISLAVHLIFEGQTGSLPVKLGEFENLSSWSWCSKYDSQNTVNTLLNHHNIT